MKTVFHPPAPLNEAPSPALVVFSNNTEFWWLKGLRPGFRHCFMVLDMGGQWVVYDPLSHQTKITLLPANRTIDLKAWYEERGCIAIACTTRAAPLKMAPFFLFTCVEAVKRVLGLHERAILTPWQLYKRLIKDFFP